MAKVTWCFLIGGPLFGFSFTYSFFFCGRKHSTTLFKRKLRCVFIMPQRWERANGYLWHQAGGFYCYVLCEIVGVLLLSLLFWIVCVWTNQKNSGWTSVDRSTKATLSTYNTWIHVSRLQKIYHFQSLKLWLTTEPLTVEAADMQQGRDLMLDM